MRKRVVIKGRICDICGRIIDNSGEADVDGSKVTISDKVLRVSMYPPYKLIRYSDMGNCCHNIARHKVLLCPECAYSFCTMFASWKSECEKRGWKERQRIKASLYDESGDMEEYPRG